MFDFCPASPQYRHKPRASEGNNKPLRLFEGECESFGCHLGVAQQKKIAGGVTQFLVHVSTYQGSILEFRFFEPQPFGSLLAWVTCPGPLAGGTLAKRKLRCQLAIAWDLKRRHWDDFLGLAIFHAALQQAWVDFLLVSVVVSAKRQLSVGLCPPTT